MSARIWWYPDPDGGVEELDLGSEWSMLEYRPQRRRAVNFSLSGRGYDVDMGGVPLVRAVLERFPLDTSTGKALWAGLASLINHLSRGGICALTNDDTIAWAAFCDTPPSAGDTTLSTLGLVYSYLPGTLSSGVQLEVEGGTPDFSREIVGTSSITGDVVTISSGLRFTPESNTVLVREQDTFIGLRLHPSQNLDTALITERGITGTLDLLLYVDQGVLTDHKESSGGFRGSSGENGLPFSLAPDVAQGLQDYQPSNQATWVVS